MNSIKLKIWFIIMVAIVNANSWLLNPQFKVELGHHNGKYPQGYYAGELGVNFDLFSNLRNQYRIGVQAAEGTVAKRQDNGDMYVGYRLKQNGVSLGFERCITDNSKLYVYESWLFYRYFIGIGSDNLGETLVGDYDETRYNAFKTSIGYMYKYVGIQISIDTDLSYGIGIQIQIGR